MNKFLLLGLFLFSVSTSGYAQQVSTTTGNTLLEACESKDEFQQAFCLGYIIGVADVDAIDGAAYPERRRSCRVEGVTNGQERDVVVKYLKDHPDERHVLAAILVVKAVAKAFPCKP